MDFLRGSELKKLILKIPVAGSSSLADARMRQTPLEEKAVRSSMCNSMVLCTLFLSGPDQLVQSKLI
eukprot:9974272-Heterocapsa_arctica.AAC.1